MIATLLLTCAILTSLAFGVLLSYGICMSLFRLFRAHSGLVAQRAAAPGPAVVQS